MAKASQLPAFRAETSKTGPPAPQSLGQAPLLPPFFELYRKKREKN